MVLLKPLVEQLTGHNDARRALITYDFLRTLGMQPQMQPFGKGNHTNIIADLPYEGPAAPALVLASHYDAVPGSPGANDNASAVAVLLGIAALYHHTPTVIPIRLAFFDAEEVGLLGSEAYVKQSGIADIKAVLNMEMVGQGSIPVLWPYVNQSDRYCQILRESVTDAHFIRYAHGHSGDHQRFLDAGVRDSICLTLIDEKDRTMLADIVRRLERPSVADPVIIMRQISDSHTFKTYHRDSDTIEHIREESLQLAQKMVLNVIGQYSGREA